MPRQTGKYRTAFRLSGELNFKGNSDSHDELYNFLNKNNYFWNSKAKKWEKVEYIASPPSEVISIRITYNLDELLSASKSVISALESKGYKLLESSKVYPNRPPNTKDGRIYLKFMPN